ncbi:hypothetical protein ACH5RR_016155 [Cinchona calisaya]|uniref:Seipin-1 n=1 Tax=Cinchona calisaya TaxID=153742 RepID=A0ABD2ZV33_9GENT
MVDKEEEEELKNYFPIPNPLLWFTKLIIFQADIFHNSLVALLSPFLFLFSLISNTFGGAEETKEALEFSVPAAAAKVPFSKVITHGSRLLLKKVVLGFLGAAYVCMILTLLLIVAVILGVGLVRYWVEEPVFVRERLHFDYTEVHPEAVFFLDGDGAFEGHRLLNKKRGVPVGHTFYVSLGFLMPESDYNREIGVFQVTAELISSNGNILAKSSHPCMLQFRSWPIRMMRTFLMGLPLLLGITAETQRLTIAMLKHKEGFPRTEAIRLTLIPRAGTYSLPQLYKAEILLKSELPWAKEIVRRWKWSFYVWTSLYAYVMLLIILLSCSRPLILPVMKKSVSNDRKEKLEVEVASEPEERSRDERHVSETLRRLQENRSKRKAMLRDIHMLEPAGSLASSISLSRGDTGPTLEHDVDGIGDSESMCYRSDVED